MLSGVQCRIIPGDEHLRLTAKSAEYGSRDYFAQVDTILQNGRNLHKTTDTATGHIKGFIEASFLCVEVSQQICYYITCNL